MLHFLDSTAIFSSQFDTLFCFRYALDARKGTLLLTAPFGKQIQATVLKLDHDSLVLSRIWVVDSIRRYYRFEYKP